MSDFLGGVAARKVDALRVVIVSYPASVVISLLIAPMFGGTISLEPMLWGVVAGVTGGLAIWWFFLALASGPMAVVSPLTAVLVAGIPVLIGLVIGERPGMIAYVGMALAMIAVLLVSKESPDKTTQEITGGRVLRFSRPVALLTVGAGTAFALDFAALHEIDAGAGLWPLVISRVAATGVVWAIALAGRKFTLPHGETLRLCCYVGALDVLANGTMMYAYHFGMLSLVSVIGALYPAATVLLAMVMLGERVGRLQYVGMVLALAAVGLIAAA